MTIVINKYDVEIDLNAAVELMSKTIRTKLDGMTFENDQDFFDAYCVLHEEKYGDEPEFGKENPVW